MPSLHHTLIETRVLLEFAASTMALPFLLNAPVGTHPVMVLPGFLATDWSTLALRKFLSLKGYKTYGWQQGRNLGQHIIPEQHLVREDLLDYVLTVVEKEQQPIHLIGWSMGGIIAREIARIMPDVISSVISLGSPFNSPEASSPIAAVIFKRLNMKRIGHQFQPPTSMAKAPPVPYTSIYSRSDGIAHWLGCHQYGEEDHIENIQVLSSHLGLGHNPAVLWLIAQRLAANASIECPKLWQPLEMQKLPGWIARQVRPEHL